MGTDADAGVGVGVGTVLVAVIVVEVGVGLGVEDAEVVGPSGVSGEACSDASESAAGDGKPGEGVWVSGPPEQAERTAMKMKHDSTGRAGTYICTPLLNNRIATIMRHLGGHTFRLLATLLRRLSRLGFGTLVPGDSPCP